MDTPPSHGRTLGWPQRDLPASDAPAPLPGGGPGREAGQTPVLLTPEGPAEVIAPHHAKEKRQNPE